MKKGCALKKYKDLKFNKFKFLETKKKTIGTFLNNLFNPTPKK